MADRILTLRELNRATLARQMLLERETIPVPAAVERLVALQAQAALPPYVGLWTRLKDFQRDDLAQPIEQHEIVKATFLRATLHILTAADYLRFRTAVQPALTEGWTAIVKKRKMSFDLNDLLAQARAYIGEKPRTFAQMSDWLAEWMPDEDVGAMRYGVRTHLPLVQVPVSTGWSYPGTPEFTLADAWLSQPIPEEDHLRELVFRYLAAFGPASAADMQTWSGLKKLKVMFEKLKPELVVYKDENRRDLFDLPDRPMPDSDAPVRFLPEFDNLLLSHSNRTRVVADEHRKGVYLPGLRVAATILVDGFVAGAWKIEKQKGAAALVIQPFVSVTRAQRVALVAEGEKLVRFVEANARSYAVRFAEE
jgi:hypothetical protein